MTEFKTTTNDIKVVDITQDSKRFELAIQGVQAAGADT